MPFSLQNILIIVQSSIITFNHAGVKSRLNCREYRRRRRNKAVLSAAAVISSVLYRMKGKDHVSISDLWRAPDNIGRVFNLSRLSINEHLDQLKALGYITINRTAGLDMVYIREDLSPSDIMVEYYKKAQAR